MARSTIQERLERNSIPVPLAGCWLWTGHVDRCGYGKICVNHRNINSHRAAWAAFRGPIPDGLHVLHSCDVPSCINPDHLFLGTHADNMRDRMVKGRYRRRQSIRGGTFIARCNKWQSKITFNGTTYYLGLHSTEAKASAAYHAKLNQLTAKVQS